MSEKDIQNTEATVSVDAPLSDQVPDSPAPPATVTDAAGKEAMKIGMAMKIGLGFMALVMVVFIWQMFFAGSDTQTQTAKKAQKPVNTQNFGKASAGDKSVDPEVQKLEEETIRRKAEEAQKKGSSYMVVEPFGKDTRASTDLSVRAPESMTSASMSTAAPPAPPSPPQPPAEGGGNGGGSRQASPQDRIYTSLNGLFKAPVPGVSLGALPPAHAQAASQQTGMVMGPNGVMVPVGQNTNYKPSIYEITAGAEFYAQLTTGVNSLVPETPVRAVILGGKYNGAVVLGKSSVRDNKYLVLTFNQMSLGKFTWPIEATGTSVETGQAGLADEVNSKFLQRHGIMAGIGFVQALGAAVIQEGTSSQIISNGAGTTVTQSNPTLSSKQKLLIGLGGAGQAASQGAAEYQKEMKPEVMVYKDREIKVIFTKPFNPS